jgi:hypothetical protein
MTTTDDERGLDRPGLAPTLTASPEDTAVSSHRPRRSVRRWFSDHWGVPGQRRVLIGWSVLIASLVVYYFVAGIPWSLNWVFIYVTAGIVISSLGTGVKWKRLVIDWLPLFLVLYVYGLLRSYASHPLYSPLVRPQAWFDTHVFGGLAPTVQLQRWLYSPGLHFWDYLVWCCYMSHFFASFIIAGVLWKTNYPKFRRFVPLFVGLTFLGYCTYVLYPAMPPWMAGGALAQYPFHYIPHVSRIIPNVLDHLHFSQGASVFTGGDSYDNNVAAMPSLHGAYPMLICLFFWKGASARKRIVLVAYPICMAFTLVYTAEHFVIDIFVGWLYAAAVFYFGSKLLDRWETRRRRKGLDQDGPWTSVIGQATSPDPEGSVEPEGEPVPVGV